MAFDKRLGWRLVAGLGAAALIATACGGGEETSDPEASGEPTSGETTDGEGGEYCNGADADLVWAHEQEPPDMHLDDPNNNLSATSWVRQSLWEGLYGISAATEFVPELLAEEMEVVENEDGTVTLNGKLREGLTWSDGEPLTAQNVVDTHNIIMEGYDVEAEEGGVYLIGSHEGYDRVTNIEATSDTEFTIEMESAYAGYKALYSEIFPTHVVPDAATANELFPDFMLADGSGPLPSSGPMVFDSWEKGVSLKLVRNDSYHGSTAPDAKNPGVACVTGVTINWVADTDAQINALKAGEADMIFTQPQLAFRDRLAEDPDFTVASEAGPVYEHWGMNLFNDHLSDVLVREALAYALDKSQVMSTLYTPLFGDKLDPNGLGNTFWLTNQTAYENHQAEYDGAQVDQAKAKLEEAGYTEGSDGIFEHPEKGRLTLRVGTTGGNGLRELQQQIIQEQMKAAGIEITIDNVPGSAYFGERPFSEDALACSTSQGEEGDCDVWDLTQFAWVGGPWPGSGTATFETGSGNNPYGYSNPDFDAKAQECNSLLDTAEQQTCYNELDKFVTGLEVDPNGLVVLPLTQKPTFFGYSNVRLSKAAVAPDANSAGPLVYVVDYVKAS